MDWDEMETVRDFLQNFYDANEADDITIKIKDREVQVFAPAVFDYQQAIYFDSDKTNDSDMIGQYYFA